MKIAIILPPATKKPVGGYKIIYSYCDLLITKNPDITIDVYYETDLWKKKFLIKTVYYNFFAKDFYKWFDFNNSDKINHIIGVNLFTKNINKYDVVFVSSISTAQFVKKSSFRSLVIYFIQHFEEWSKPKKEVLESYHFGFKNIVVSQWLNEILVNDNADVALKLPNPIDNIFSVDKPLKKRQLNSVLFMYHIEKWKGSAEAVEVMKKLKQKNPEIKISCFSVFKKPENLPSWINYIYRPTRTELKGLMNNHFLFLSASYKEGYGLPAAEAMGSGCCVVTTNSGGVSDFAMDKNTAYVVSSPPNIDEIYDKIESIFQNPKEAFKVAENGSKLIRKFSWQKNINKLIKLIEDERKK